MKEIGRKIKKFFTEKVKPFLLNNNKRNLKIILVALAALIIILGTLTGIYINKKLNLMQTGDKGIDFSNKDTSLEDDEDYDFDVMRCRRRRSSMHGSRGQQTAEKNVQQKVLSIFFVWS